MERERPLPLGRSILVGQMLITSCELVTGLLGVFVSGVAGAVAGALYIRSMDTEE